MRYHRGRDQDRPSRQNARLAGVLLWGLIILLFVSLSGCAGTPHLTESTERQLPRHALLESVPFHGQRDYQCGPASLAMVLEHQGVETDVDTLIPQVFLPGREGSVQPEMLAAVRRHGRIPFPIDNRFEALLQEIDAGHPVVVLQNLSLPAWPLWHYAVAIGFDLDARELILHSGEEAGRRESFRRFDATWARSDRWAFVALPPGELPLGTTASDAMRAIADFERVQPDAALPAWAALTERFPNNGMVHFARGNALHASGDAPGAIAAFEAAVTQDPELSAAWLNLGLLLSQQQRPDDARRALQHAAERPGPWQARARDALRRL